MGLSRSLADIELVGILRRHDSRGAAQRVEHYEIAAYTTARNLASQLHLPDVVELLTMSLGEELNAGQLLDQVARPLMSAARMPSSVE
jgi:Mn-containing catalase